MKPSRAPLFLFYSLEQSSNIQRFALEVTNRFRKSDPICAQGGLAFNSTAIIRVERSVSEAYSWCFMAKPFVICHGGGNRGTGSHCARNSRLCMHVCVVDRSFVLQLLWLSRSRSSLFIVPSVSGELSVICSKIAAIIAGLADIISRLERTSYAAGSILITIECTDGDARKTPVYGNTCIVHCLSISTLLDSTSIKRDLIAI